MNQSKMLASASLAKIVRTRLHSYRSGSLLGYCCGGRGIGGGRSSSSADRLTLGRQGKEVEGRKFSAAAAFAASARCNNNSSNSGRSGGSSSGSSSSNRSQSLTTWAAAAAAVGAGAAASSAAWTERNDGGHRWRNLARCDGAALEGADLGGGRSEEETSEGSESTKGGTSDSSSDPDTVTEDKKKKNGEVNEGILATSFRHHFGHMAGGGGGGGGVALVRRRSSARPTAFGGSSPADDDRDDPSEFDDDSDSDDGGGKGGKLSSFLKGVLDKNGKNDDDDKEENSPSLEEEDDAAAAAEIAAINSHNFQLLAAMESWDEQKQVQLARLLHELHSIATESPSFLTASSSDSSDSDSDDRSSRALRRDSAGGRAHARRETADSTSCGNEQGLLNFCPLSDMTPAKISILIESLRNGGKFDRKSLRSILYTSHKMLKHEPSLVDLRKRGDDRVTVVGDLHGSIQCLTDVLDAVSDDLERGHAVVFNGDFVDRGENSLEVILTLLLLKLSRPDQVYLCRGNHEDSFLSTVYGFEDELRAKYGLAGFRVLWDMLCDVFSAMPVCVRTETAVVMHGGLPHANFDLREVEEITAERRCRVRSTLEPKDDVETLLQGLLWSDPCPNTKGIRFNVGRGAGRLFGPDVARSFLDRHGLRYIVRSHEVTEQGWEAMDCGDGRYVLTVFSTASYPNGEGFNKGAVLRLNNDRDGTVEPVQFLRTNQLPNGHLTEKALRSVVERIMEHRELLTDAFLEVAKGAKDVTKDQWASVMASTLHLHDLDWMALQPSLAPTTVCDDCDSDSSSSNASTKDGCHACDGGSGAKLQDTGLIDWRRFLTLHSHCIHLSGENNANADDDDGTGGGGISESDLEAAYANHAMLLTVFKFLDTDGNGRVDAHEFEAGVNMVNRCLPENRRVRDPQRLFRALDLDRNGMIELDEFSEVFKVHDIVH